tara:strand:- start:51 stop:299 length:249 start_codon:yes stop_codon:yes gene_type:complete
MAGIGDYEKKGKGSRGYKMKGYSYPGESPLKGKKKEQKLAAKEDHASAMDAIDEFGSEEIESTNIMEEEGFRVSGAALPPSS